VPRHLAARDAAGGEGGARPAPPRPVPSRPFPSAPSGPGHSDRPAARGAPGRDAAAGRTPQGGGRPVTRRAAMATAGLPERPTSAPSPACSLAAPLHVTKQNPSLRPARPLCVRRPSSDVAAERPPPAESPPAAAAALTSGSAAPRGRRRPEPGARTPCAAPAPPPRPPPPS
jgi:hypothetical protein